MAQSSRFELVAHPVTTQRDGETLYALPPAASELPLRLPDVEPSAFPAR